MKKGLFFAIFAFGIFILFLHFQSINIEQAVTIQRGSESISSAIKKINEPASRRFEPFFTSSVPLEKIQKITYIALKREKIFEIWAYDGQKWHKLRTMPILGASGGEGHKLRQGDWQVPEGLYKLDYFNPNSQAHLSLHVNYPNKEDRRWAQAENRQNLGGDIMIHGGRSSIGCISLGDVGIEDIFWLSHKIGLKSIDLIISPYDMRIKNDVFPEGFLGERYKEIQKALTNFS